MKNNKQKPTQLHRNVSSSRVMYGTERTIMFVLLLTILGLAALYVYFISVTVSNVVFRKELSLEIRATDTRVGELESSYLAKADMIDRTLASTLGFTEVESKQFVAHHKVEDDLVTFNNVRGETSNQ